MRRFDISGMSCAACSARVEKAVSKLDGIKSCSVNLLTNSMAVEGEADDETIISAVVSAGYGAKLSGSANDTSSDEKSKKKVADDVKKLILRFSVSLFFLLTLMYVSMGHMMWNWKLPTFLEGNHIAIGILELLLTVIIMVINGRFFISGFKSLWHLSPNMDTLVAIGSGASFIYSTYALFAMTDAQLKMDHIAVTEYMHEFYFESAAMILTLITLGKMLEAIAKGKTTDALDKLMKLAPEYASVIKDGKEERVPVKNVKIGDVFIVRPGESIPVDAVIIEGESAIDESALTGESIPVDKRAGDNIFCATINQSGAIKCEAVGVGENTALSRIIQMVSDASATKAPIAKAADRVAGVFVPAVILIATVTFAVWLVIGNGVGYALARGISVLVISCPCALGLATPVSVMVGNGVGAKNGILFKNAEALEETGKVSIVALDKTGTVTVGMPKLTDIVPTDGEKEEDLIAVAYSLEKQSEHPLAKAIVSYGEEKGIAFGNVTGFKALSGNGLSGILDGNEVFGGSLKFISEICDVPKALCEACETLSEEGKTPMLFARNKKVLGVIAVADVVKEESAAAIKALKGMGIRTIMITGDNEKTARTIARLAGIDEVVAGVLPDGKEKVIRELRRSGKVAMVGDGINDAPALTAADMGIAIGNGTDIAIDAADVILMKSNMLDLPAAIKLSRKTLANIHMSLFWAFFYNTIGIPIAAGVLIPLGIELNPMIAAAAMSLSSVCVVCNALRLNLVNIYKTSNREYADVARISEKIKNNNEEDNMKKTIMIEGMMCAHCEAHVKEALCSISGVGSAEVSHKDGCAVVTLNGDVSDNVLKQAVEKEGYKVNEIK